MTALIKGINVTGDWNSWSTTHIIRLLELSSCSFGMPVHVTALSLSDIVKIKLRKELNSKSSYKNI